MHGRTLLPQMVGLSYVSFDCFIQGGPSKVRPTYIFDGNI